MYNIYLPTLRYFSVSDPISIICWPGTLDHDHCDNVQVGTKCWKVVETPTETWLDAADKCSAEGAVLGSVTSASELTTVSIRVVSWPDKLHHSQVSGMLSSEGAWIGLQDILQEGTFSWRDGSELTYTNWKTNNPNNANSEQHCVWMRGDDYTWDDITCRRKEPYLCQKTARSRRRTP